MKHKNILNKIISAFISLAVVTSPFNNVVNAEEFHESELVSVDVQDELVEEIEYSLDELPGVYLYEAPEPIEETEATAESHISQEEIELIALITMAEAEDEPEYGKRLVIDTIFNRVDSEKFPNTIVDVATQPHQYTSLNSDRMNRCFVREDIYQLVIEEYESRTNYDVIFFTSNGYSQYGTPMFQECCHCFSSL